MHFPGLGVGILLESKKHGNHWCIIDRADAALVLDGRGKWLLRYDPGKNGGRFYAHRHLAGTSPRKTQLMHALIAGTLKGQDTRHLNGDSLDNRRCNVVAGTRLANMQEKKCHRDGHLVGTYWRKDLRKWESRLNLKGDKAYLGFFDTAEDAHKAYCSALAQRGLPPPPVLG